MDAISISDLHLGSDICQVKPLAEFLDKIHHRKIKTKELILNGDVFDNLNFHRLNKRHWNILSTIRKLSDHVHVTWINGNHDGPAELISHLLGVDVMNEYVLESGNKHILFLHGDIFDKWTNNHPILTWFADFAYSMLMKIDKSFELARAAKRASKTFMRNSEIIRRDATVYADELGCDVVCCGHSHHPLASENYYNSGSWTELPCTYITVKDGRVELCQFK